MDDSNKHNSEDYHLNKAELEKVAEHFNSHIGDRSCHICGGKEWHPLASVYTPIIFDRVKNSHRQDRLMPTVMVACDTCGATTSFIIGKVGIRALNKNNDGDE